MVAFDTCAKLACNRVKERTMGRLHRPDNAPTVIMQARVAPSVRATVQAAANKSGVSQSLYLERFLVDYIETHGELPQVTPEPVAQELPIELNPAA